jgi:hypothetical protein
MRSSSRRRGSPATDPFRSGPIPSSTCRTRSARSPRGRRTSA